MRTVLAGVSDVSVILIAGSQHQHARGCRAENFSISPIFLLSSMSGRGSISMLHERLSSVAFHSAVTVLIGSYQS